MAGQRLGSQPRPDPLQPNPPWIPEGSAVQGTALQYTAMHLSHQDYTLNTIFTGENLPPHASQPAGAGGTGQEGLHRPEQQPR